MSEIPEKRKESHPYQDIKWFLQNVNFGMSQYISFVQGTTGILKLMIEEGDDPKDILELLDLLEESTIRAYSKRDRFSDFIESLDKEETDSENQ